MHDGDQREVTVSQNAITTQPSGNDQTWQVHADFDVTYRININVLGKPSPMERDARQLQVVALAMVSKQRVASCTAVMFYRRTSTPRWRQSRRSATLSLWTGRLPFSCAGSITSLSRWCQEETNANLMLEKCEVAFRQVAGKAEQLLVYPVRAQTVPDKTKVCDLFSP